jgi:SAM-dependent methyltransferase
MEELNKSADLFYLVEKRKHEPKESFKFTYQMVKDFLNTVPQPSIADIGCATGEFIYYLNTVYSNAHYFGYDINPQLVARAKAEVPFATIDTLDITKKEQLPSERFDLVFMNGVNGAFENPYDWLPNFLSLLKENGRAYVYGIFNPDDLDVIVRVRKPEDSEGYISYWNNISQKTISKVAKELGYRATFYPFKINIDIQKNLDNPFRSWTFKLENGERALINGTQVLHNFYLLEMRK